MTPVLYLLLLVSLVVIGLVTTYVTNYVRSRKVFAEATKLGLQFSRPDRFLLSKRVALKLPVPGAAEVSVRDIAYATSPQGLLCVMTARFTIGSTGRRRHVRRVCAALDQQGGTLEHFTMLPDVPTPEAYAKAHATLRSAVNAVTA